MSRRTWKDDAECRTDPGVHWFEHPTTEMVAACSRCPVVDQCLQEALRFDWRHDVGFWGGTDEYQRRAIRKRTMTVREARAASVTNAARGQRETVS